MQEDVSGIRIIKACVRETYEKIRFSKANDALIKTQLRTLLIFAFMNPVVNAIMYLTVALILLTGSHEVRAGTATPGSIMAAITYTTQLLHGILMLVMLFQNISRGLASWKRIREVLGSQPELTDGCFDGDTRVQGGNRVSECFLFLSGQRKIRTFPCKSQYPPGRNRCHHGCYRLRQIHSGEPDPPVL